MSEKIELDKEIELEKSKIESYLENIFNLEKRLNKLIESSQNKNDLTVQAELLELSESYQSQLINFKIDYERHLSDLPSDQKNH